VTAPVFAVLHPIPEVALGMLEEAGEVRVGTAGAPLPAAELGRLVEGADAIISLPTDPIDGAVADLSGPGLKIVANVAVGFDNISLGDLASRGIAVTNTPDVIVSATADLALALILMVTRRLGEGERLIRSSTDWAVALDFMLGRSMEGRTLGVIGLGQVGRATAARARAIGMRIIYYSRTRAAPEVEVELEATPFKLDQLLAEADVVSLHCPLNEGTHHLIDATALARMKPSAYLINTSRGPVVDEAALAKALSDGTIAGAALDVFEREPRVHPSLLGLENVILVPHLGTATVETREHMAVLAARNATAVVAGLSPLTPVIVERR
jgi:glyoxylate reductase